MPNHRQHLPPRDESPYDGLVPDAPKPDPQPTPDPEPQPVPGDDNMGKGLLRSRTFWVNALTAVASIGTYIMNSELLVNNPEIVAGIGTGLGIVNVFLRLVTKEPISGVK